MFPLECKNVGESDRKGERETERENRVENVKLKVAQCTAVKNAFPGEMLPFHSPVGVEESPSSSPGHTALTLSVSVSKDNCNKSLWRRV